MVTPAEVCKIRMQAQFHSLLDPEEMARRKYRNVLQTAVVVAREEGVGALYKGLAPTVLRQGCNQVKSLGNLTFAGSCARGRRLSWSVYDLCSLGTESRERYPTEISLNP